MDSFLKPLPVQDIRRYSPETVRDLVVLSDSEPLTHAHIVFLIDIIFRTDTFKNFALGQISNSDVVFDNIISFFQLFDRFFLENIPSSGDSVQRNGLILEFEAFQNYKKQFQFEINRFDLREKKNKKAVFWPDPTGKYHGSTEGANLVLSNFELIDKNTPIGSAGSCFADEMAFYFQQHGYNYVVEEMVKRENDNGFANSSAAWGVLFNTPSFMQIAERAFGLSDFPPLIDKVGDGEDCYYHDPYRENIVADQPAAIHALREAHKQAARQAFEKCEVFIVTLGLNECFQNIVDGSVVSRNPKNSSSYSLLNHRVLSVQENVDCLQRFLDIIRAHNPKFKLIVTVSPVPFLATGRGDEMHVITANTHSKAVLRVAAEEFVSRNEGVWYFPAYEVVTVATRDPWEPDLRHVKRETVARVMRTFERMFVKGTNPRLDQEVDEVSI